MHIFEFEKIMAIISQVINLTVEIYVHILRDFRDV